MPRLGIIRLGEKREGSGGKSYPAALDYFNLKDAPSVAKAFGPKPKSIEIVLPHEDTAVFFQQYRKAYRTSGLFCKGDGETANRVRLGMSDGNKTRVKAGDPYDPDGERFIKEQGLQVKVGDRFEMPCLAEQCPFTVQKFCRPLAQFLFLVPKADGFGCYQISTTSFNSMVELNSYIEAIRAAAGRISMIPLTLSLAPKKVTVAGQAKSIHHLKLEYRGQLSELVKFRDAKYLSADILPQIGREVPEELYAGGGSELEKHLSGAPAAEPGPDAEPDAEIIEEGAAFGQEQEPPPPHVQEQQKQAPAPARPAAPPKAAPKPPTPQRRLI